MLNYNSYKVPTSYLEDIANYMNKVYQCKGDMVTSVLGVLKAYDREIKVLWWTNQSPEEAGDFLSQFLIMEGK